MVCDIIKSMTQQDEIKFIKTIKAPIYETQLRILVTLFAEFPSILGLFQAQILVINDLKKQAIPQIGLPQLLMPENTFSLISDYLIQINDTTDQSWDNLTFAASYGDWQLRNFRTYLSETFGMWAYINQPIISAIHHAFPKANCLELMAGNAWLSAGLMQLGHTVITTDNLEWADESATGSKAIVPVISMDAKVAVKTYGTSTDLILMAWSPDHNPIDQQVLAQMRATVPNATLLCIGERNGATNSDDFWQQITLVEPIKTKKINRQLSHFDLMNDQVYLIK